MHHWLLVILAWVSLVSPLRVNQQSALQAENMLIDLWPEYDRAEMLVIYRLSLAADTRLPAELTLRIPKAAGEPFNVAMQENGALYNLEYNTHSDGDWLEIRFITPSLQVQVEYYDPRLNRSLQERSYEFRWPGGLAVRNMAVQIQQPINATNMKITPNMGQGATGKDGITYFQYDVGNIDADTSFTISLRYIKPDNTLTFGAGGGVEPVQPVDAQTSGRTSFFSLLPWALAGLGVLLIAGGAYWYWQSGRWIIAPSRHRHRTKQSEGNLLQPDGDIYCHQCGKRAEPTDVFCRSCGTRLRR